MQESRRTEATSASGEASAGSMGGISSRCEPENPHDGLTNPQVINRATLRINEARTDPDGLTDDRFGRGGKGAKYETENCDNETAGISEVERKRT